MKPTVDLDLGLWAARLSYIIENSPVSYLIIEPSGRIAYANDATRLSLGSNMSLGINIFNYLNIVKSLAMETI
ncbi:MAG: PAS domain-containing protein [Holophagales bacterium]|jgi:PAS domain-containing protein|nr:PAS domain-containing protein [Holophagales bacterium]